MVGAGFWLPWIILVQLGMASTPAAGAPARDISQRLFAETGYTVEGAFLDYWNTTGGLFSYGYPITTELQENGYTVQYFERARFELHPENAGSVYDVLLGRLGWQLTSTHDFPPAQPDGKSTYFPETHHNLRDELLTYWQQYGGLSRFGYPISEELTETSSLNGHPYTVQYFERARFEYHPENGGEYRVLLGQLGKEILALELKASTFVQVEDGQLVSGPILAPIKLKGFNSFPARFRLGRLRQMAQ